MKEACRGAFRLRRALFGACLLRSGSSGVAVRVQRCRNLKQKLDQIVRVYLHKEHLGARTIQAATPLMPGCVGLIGFKCDSKLQGCGF